MRAQTTHDGTGALLKDETLYVLAAHGPTAPTDGLGGYRPGAIFIDTDSGVLYVNESTNAASCDFNAISGSAGNFVATAGDTMTGVLLMADDIKIALGTDSDIALRHKTTATNANTVVTAVVIGTPVTPALAANSLIVSNITADGDILLATQTGGNSQAALFVDASANTTDLFAAGVRIARVSAAAGLTLGLAGTTLGKLTLSGNTAGVITVNTAATAGDWALTLPPDDGDAGEQLQTNGSGVTTWEAAGSLREVKNVIAEISDQAESALTKLLEAGVYAFTYRPAGRPTTGDYLTEYVGVMADELPEVMHHGGRIFSPVSAFGMALLAIKALTERIQRLEAAG